MNPQSIKSNSLIGPQTSVRPVIPVTQEESSAPTTADRIYQIAALTAGIFLLATLL